MSSEEVERRDVVDASESAAESELAATATKHKLEKLMTEFAEFDDVMRIGTRVRGLLALSLPIRDVI